MDMAIQPRTAPGRRFFELAELHAKEAADAAQRHDREGTFPVSSFLG